MLSIGAFAQVGQVTHRMLRHWDRAGLLVPAHTDPFNGYRSYDPEQLERLHRIVALRQLGFGIEEISALLEDGIDAEELKRMLQRRRTEVEEEYRTAAARMADVERRLHLIERQKVMSTLEILKKPLSSLQLAARTVTVHEQPELATLVGPTFGEVADMITASGGEPGEAIAVYSQDDDGLTAIIGFTYSGPPAEGVETIDLLAEQDAFVAVHLGAIDGIAQSWHALHEEIVARGFEPSGPCREVYLRADESGRRDEFVIELQQPVRTTSSEF